MSVDLSEHFVGLVFLFSSISLHTQSNSVLFKQHIDWRGLNSNERQRPHHLLWNPFDAKIELTHASKAETKTAQIQAVKK